jgi:hypothetical protein
VALQGTLETFSVPEVLRLLSGTRKTGLLALEGDRGAGSVWLAEGLLAGAQSDREPEGTVESVLFDLLRYRQGSFVFESEAQFDGDPVALDVDEALTAAEALLADWHEIEAVVPSLSVRLSMARALPGPTATVTAAQWEALALVAGGGDGHHLSRELGLGELDTSRRIRDLAEAGLVEIEQVAETPSWTEPEPVAPIREEWSAADSDLTSGLAGFVAQGQPDEWDESDDEDPAPTAIDLVDDRRDEEPVDDLGWDFEDAPAAEADTDVEIEGEQEDDGYEAPAAAAAADDADAVDATSTEGPADDDGEPDEFLSQLANLSPKAAAAIEATAATGETAGAAPQLPEGEADEEINRNLLLKFLSSTKN